MRNTVSQNSLLCIVYRSQETSGVTLGRWKQNYHYFLLGRKVFTGCEVLLQLMPAVTYLLVTWLVWGSAWVCWISPFRFSHFWARCVFSSLRKSIRFTCRPPSSLKLVSCRRWDTDTGSGSSWQMALILAAFVLSLLPLFMAVLSSYLLALLTSGFIMKNKSNSLCIQSNSSHNWIEPKPYHKFLSVHLLPRASASLFALWPLYPSTCGTVVCPQQTSRSFHFIQGHWVKGNSAGCWGYRDEQSRIWVHMSHTIWWED